MASDPPPAYSTLDASTTNLAAVEEGAPNCDDGSELLVNNSFENRTTRIGFIQKVLALKLLQLILVAVVLGIIEGTKWHVQQWYMLTSSSRAHLIVTFILLFMVTVWLLVKVCRNQNRQQKPIRYLFLVVHPLTFAFVVIFLTIFWDFLGPVLVAWLTYCGAVFALLMYSIFALHTKLEFLAKYEAVVAVCVQLLFYAILASIFEYDAFFVLYVSIVLALETSYVIWDLEIMTSKSYWSHITPGDFFDGVLNLHFDYYYFMTKLIYPKLLDSVVRGETPLGH